MEFLLVIIVLFGFVGAMSCSDFVESQERKACVEKHTPEECAKLYGKEPKP